MNNVCKALNTRPDTQLSTSSSYSYIPVFKEGSWFINQQLQSYMNALKEVNTEGYGNMPEKYLILLERLGKHPAGEHI